MTRPDDLVARLGRWSAGRGPLYLLLAGRIRRLIDEGELQPGAPLPPDRSLASALAVGRTTVVSAYDLLTQEGRIVRRQGSGTRVAPAALQPDPQPDAANPLFMHLLEPMGKIVQLTCAAPKAMPRAVTEAYSAALATEITDDTGYHPLGYHGLRVALANRFTARGLPTKPGQILVTTGGQQALALLARLFVAPGDRVVVETPTYPGALDAFRETTPSFLPVPVGDADGLVRAMRRRPAAVYLIPTHHNPTGLVMSTLTRQRLAASALELGVRLIEDEVLADLSFDGSLPLPIAAYGPAVTIGSLSKVVWGGLRVGWVRASESVIMQLARHKAVHDLGSNYIGQVAAASLVSSLDTLGAARSSVLLSQHSMLCSALREHLPSWEFTPASGGQSLWVRLPFGDAVSFAQLALRHGVAVLPGGAMDASGASKDYLRIPFLEPSDVLAGAVESLAAAWHEYRPGAPGESLTTLVV
ncbi:PLP-dependent aminotransferase family protein [Kibdelosporangium philippinense]|uniref:PLP-dependent aminotransferase family protein n=1 Tax=Kibdelosporangium philippinense TaxID=211113 RepID=A0ABS8Z5B8_9PSEU|nr:PLP-dependent aminotransferase family protein [Kibdelosporangium philippinense]MCE7002687.1 PLP-dependent aminotransferase family protein [Kibdelosporangium philippinense]